MYLFPTFLDNVDEYRACEAFWARLVERAAQASGTGLAWVSWIPKTYANGTPFPLDGNPICDGRSAELSRAFRIIQWAPSSDEEWIIGCVDSYPLEFDELPRAELILSLVLTTATADLAEECLTLWMRRETSVGGIKAFIEDRLSKPRNQGDS